MAVTVRGRHAAGPLRLDGERKQAVDTGRARVLLTGAAVFAVFAVIGVRLIDVTAVQGGMEPRETRAQSAARGPAVRAEITDRNGFILAANLATASLIADTESTPAPERAAAALASVLPDLDRKAVAARLAGEQRYVVLRRHLTPNEQYAINRLGIPGLEFRREQRRIYPAGALTAHTVGFTDPDGRGLAGIERRLDSELRARAGPLALSIDVRVQHALRRALRDRMKVHSASGAAGLVLDVTTGEVLAMCSLPDFDPNRASGAKEAQRFNRVTLGIYEMGSTFKIFNTALALETGRVRLSDGFDATRPIRVARHWIRDFHPQRRYLTIPEIFMHSSNIGSAKMALAVGGRLQRAFLGKLGLLTPAAVEVGEVGRPLFPRTWRPVNTMTISYGYGLAVSPLQLAAGVAAVVNGGVMRAPTLLRASRGEAERGRRVLSPATSEKMRRLLRLVVARGTGRRAAAPGYLVGGKTGTAEQAAVGGYDRRRLLATFVAAFPMHRPRFVVLAMLEGPKGTAETAGYATGGWVAAPAVSQVVRRIGPVLGVEPVDESSFDVRKRMHVDIVSASEGGTRRAAR